MIELLLGGFGLAVLAAFATFVAGWVDANINPHDDGEGPL